MNIEMINPFWLFIFPIMVGAFYWIAKNKIHSTFRRRFFIFIRSIVSLFLILALCGVTIQKTSERVTTLFAVDLSDSTKQAQESVKTFLKQAESTRTEKDDIGLLCFGAIPNKSSSFSPDFFILCAKKRHKY